LDAAAEATASYDGEKREANEESKLERSGRQMREPDGQKEADAKTTI